MKHILGTQTSTVEDDSCLSHYSQLLRCFVALHSRESRGESVREQLPAFLLSTLDLKEIQFTKKLSPSLLSCSLSTPNSSLQQRKAAVERSEGVNDLWSAPAADVGGMEVNRDEVFSIEPRLT